MKSLALVLLRDPICLDPIAPAMLEEPPHRQVFEPVLGCPGPPAEAPAMLSQVLFDRTLEQRTKCLC